MPRIVPRVGPRGHRYRLTVNHNVHSMVTREPDTPDYAASTRVTLTAVPGDGWQFWHWRGDLHGSENPAEVVMDRHKHVVAVFRRAR